MEKTTWQSKPENYLGFNSMSKWNFFAIIEAGPNGHGVRHRMNEAGGPFRSEAETQLWIGSRMSNIQA
jgi:hypothetical protein